jgi:hypothetical protein
MPGLWGGQIKHCHLLPAEFEREANCPVHPSWRDNILVDPGHGGRSRDAMTLGEWLKKNRIQTNEDGRQKFKRDLSPEYDAHERPLKRPAFSR